MSHETAASTSKDSQLTRFIPSLLGLSLIPLHLTNFISGAYLDWLLIANHLIFAGLWYVAVSGWRQALAHLLITGIGLTAIAITWSISAATTAWLLVLISLVSAQATTGSRLTLLLLLSSAYLLSVVGYQHFYVDPMGPTNAPLIATLTLNILASLAFAACLVPVPAQRDPEKEKTIAHTRGLFAAAILSTLVAIAALATIPGMIDPGNFTQPITAVAALLAAVGVLIGRRRTASLAPSGRADEFRRWVAETLEKPTAWKSEEEFLHNRLSALADLVEINGLEWQIANFSGSLGPTGDSNLQIETVDGLIIATLDHAPSDVFIQRMQLALALLNTLVRFHLQQAQLKTQSHLESIYETGARITHDVKNLLQSLNTLTTAVEHSKPDQAAQIQVLIRKQLPVIRQKLQTTLEKLEAPEDVSSTYQVARIWWEKLRARYESEHLIFDLQLSMDYLIPRDLFERVAENLLENAQRKRQTEPDITIRIEFAVTEQRITLRVTDTGSPAPAEIASVLFKGPIDSTGGYGIALYQCATQALRQGFELRLTHNEPGCVSFCLSGEID